MPRMQGTTEHLELWTRIAAFDLDAVDAELPFSARLARDNGWSRAFAVRAIEEYKRFVFLAMAAGHPVTPSDEVDQVWHLHLCYTRSYWEDLCGEVLRAPLHHGPTRGGAAERARFDDQYRRTLASYEVFFEEPPPVAWWPSPVERFARRRWRRVDLGARRTVPRSGVLAAAAAALALGFSSCSGTFEFTERSAITTGLVLLGTAFALWRGRRGRGSGDGCRSFWSGGDGDGDGDGDGGCGGCGGCGD